MTFFPPSLVTRFHQGMSEPQRITEVFTLKFCSKMQASFHPKINKKWGIFHIKK